MAIISLFAPGWVLAWLSEYRRGVSNPHSSTADASVQPRWPAVLTWKSRTEPRLESVRVQLVGSRIKAYGRIVAGATDLHPAFSASYDLVTDEAGVTRRLSLHVATAERESQLSITRDGEGIWLIQSTQGSTRSSFNGALDVDVVFSPFFNALPIRRIGLHATPGAAQLPLVYVNLPELSVVEAQATYHSGSSGISLISPVSSTTITVDDEGFIVDYPGLAERI